MNQPCLVIMAAGMGSRFGGPKQTTPVDEYGHFLLHYSLFALTARASARSCSLSRRTRPRSFVKASARPWPRR